MGKEKTNTKRTILTVIILVAGLAFLLWSALFDWNKINQYKAYDTTSITYTKAKVIKVLKNDVEIDPLDKGRVLGGQTLKVKLLEGKNKGKVLEVDNSITELHNVYAKKGATILICADEPEGVTPYYTVYNYYREPGIGALVMVFAAAMLFVGRKKGFRALLGLAYTMGVVVFFTIQAIYHGFSPYTVAFITIFVSSIISLILLNGISKRSACGMAGTLLGTLFVGVLTLIFNAIFHINGFNTTDADSLQLVNQVTGLSLQKLLFATVLISALGAVMDVAVSLTASLDELITVNPNLTKTEIIQSGMNIGKDMIGTMSNTLILAFAGSGMTMMLSLISFGYSLRQFLSSDYFAVEMSQGICSTIGVIITVPITSIICAFVLNKADEH